MAETPIRLLSPAQEEELQRIVKVFQDMAAEGARIIEQEGAKMRQLFESLARHG